MYTFKNYNEINKQLAMLRADSTTKFVDAIDILASKISSYMDQLSILQTNHTIVFFTDGQDSDKTPAHKLITRFKNFVQTTNYIQVHTIGLGSHDAKFLNELTATGGISG